MRGPFARPAPDRGAVRLLFCLVAAVSAATLADPLIEWASNAGLFGAGTYTDHSNLDVVPAFVVAVVLALLYVGRRTWHAFVPQTSRAFERRFGASLRAGGSRRVASLLPAIYGLQLAVLFSMETLEQIAVGGHVLSGTLWLGAPVAIALALHGVAGLVAAYALARALDGLTHIVVDFTRFVRAVFLGRSPARGSVSRVLGRPRETARTRPLASRAGLRAPPFLSA